MVDKRILRIFIFTGRAKSANRYFNKKRNTKHYGDSPDGRKKIIVGYTGLCICLR